MSASTTEPGILGTGIQEGLLLKPVTYPWAMELYDQADLPRRTSPARIGRQRARDG